MWLCESDAASSDRLDRRVLIHSRPGELNEGGKDETRRPDLAKGVALWSLTDDAMLLATGAEPVRLELPGGDLTHVHYLRTLADSRAVVARSVISKQAVRIGASFIDLEVAASLRARNIDVHVVALETCPMEKILGAQVGNFIRKLHEEPRDGKIQSRRPRPVEFGGGACERQDRPSSYNGLRLQGIHASRQRGRTAIRVGQLGVATTNPGSDAMMRCPPPELTNRFRQ